MADILEDFFNKFKLVSYHDMIDFIIEEPYIQTLHDEYLYYVNRISSTNEKITRLQEAKRFKYNNLREKSIPELFERIKNMLLKDEFDLNLLNDESLETFIKFNKRNKHLSLKESTDNFPSSFLFQMFQ